MCYQIIVASMMKLKTSLFTACSVQGWV